MARFSLVEEANPRGKKRSAGGEEVCSCGSSKKGKKRPEEDEAEQQRDEEEGKDMEEEEEEEGGGQECVEGEGIGEGGGQSSGDGSVCVRIDPDVLDCSVCYEPLRTPIFQCQNGHVACSSCCSKMSNKCHLCSHTIGYNRCLALEKVIESVKFSCLYVKYGCNRTISYADKDAHEETCIYAPCSCPVHGCSFGGSREMLSTHYISVHNSYERFSYNQIFKVELYDTDPFRVLYGEDGHLFLLLNNSVANVGNALSIVCFRPRSLKWDFLYELTTDIHVSSCNRSCLQLKSSTTNIREWKVVYPMKVFLLVPPDLCTPNGNIILDICIRKIRTAVK